ncbi:uncharacterized protein LOC142144655 isoform X1 [Mixophyes fleayi]|uniref:uncharacterized protein LOC142144655 isoform X1 n=1 Tax=Mixophyes fleayi TaxID=3061075 RepID=UPI003F4DA265
MSSPPALFLTVECGLIQKELLLKAKLLMYHMKNLYRGNQTLIHRVVSVALSSSHSNDRSVIMGSFEKDAKLLIENVALVKETLKSAVCFTKKEDVEFLVDHLFFLTTDIVSRTRLLIENQQQWDIFMLEAMYLNWIAKANQLILHLQSNTEMDVTVLTFIKQCLRMGERTGTPITNNPSALEKETSNASIQSVNINVRGQRAAKESEPKTSTHREQAAANGHCNNTVFKQIAPSSEEYSEIDGSDEVSSDNSLISKEQSTIEGTQRKVLNTGHKAKVRKSIQVLKLMQELGTTNIHSTTFPEKPFKTSVEQTTSAQSNESLCECEIKSVQMESVNQKTNMDPHAHKNATNQESAKLKAWVTTGLQDINCKKLGMKTQQFGTGVQKETTNWKSMKHKTHKVLTGIQKETTNQETKNLKTHAVLTGVQEEAANQQSRGQKTHAVLTGVQEEAGNQQSRDQTTHAVLTGVQKEAGNQQSTDHKKHIILSTVQEAAGNQQSRDQKTYTVLTGAQKEINIQESMDEKTHTECIVIQKDAFGLELRSQKTHTVSTGVQNGRSVQELIYQKKHNLVTVMEKETTNQEIGDHKAHMVPIHMTIAGEQTEIANQESTNQKTHSVLTRVTKETTNKESKVSISENKIKCSQWKSANDRTQLVSKEGQMKTGNQKLTNQKTDMTRSRRQKEISNERKLALNQRIHKKINKESETQNKHMTLYSLPEYTELENMQQEKYKEEKQTSCISQTVSTFNLVEMDKKKPLGVSSEIPRNTTVIVEHQKVNCTSLEDICWQPHRVAKCLLAEEVEMWEV